jgi:O-antigen/teichoic acid export membrane protein
VGVEPIGIASSIAALVDIVSTIIILDMHLGMKRSLGIASSSRNYGKYKQILSTTTILVSMLIAISVMVILWPNLDLLKFMGLEQTYSWVIIVMIPFMAFRYLFSESLIAAMASDKLLLPFILGAGLRFPVFFSITFFLASPVLGTIIGYFCMIIIASVFFAIYSIKIFRGRTDVRALGEFLPIAKNVITTSLSSWAPHLLFVLGYQLSIISTLLVGGAEEAGKFYLPLGIFTVTLFIVMGVSKVTHSLIGSMKTSEEQANFLSYTMTIAFLFTMPISMPLLIYPHEFLGIIGPEFAEASSALFILMISLPMVTISEIVFYFVYGKGEHRAVLYLGLAGNIPSIVLYFILPPLLGINGAAIAWLIGSIIQMAASVHHGKRHHVLRLEYKKYFLVTVIPLLIGIFMSFLNIQFFIASIIIIIASYLVYVRFDILTDLDVYNLVYSGFPKNKAKRIYLYAERMMQFIRR